MARIELKGTASAVPFLLALSNLTFSIRRVGLNLTFGGRCSVSESPEIFRGFRS